MFSCLVFGSVTGMGVTLLLAWLLRLTLNSAPASRYARGVFLLSLVFCLFVWLPLLPDLISPVQHAPGDFGDEGKALEAVLGLFMLPVSGGAMVAWGLLKAAAPSRPDPDSPELEWMPVSRGTQPR